MNAVIKTHEQIERHMQIVQELGKEIIYHKSECKWYWFDRDNIDINRHFLESCVGPFDTFLDAVADIVEPYVKDSE